MNKKALCFLLILVLALAEATILNLFSFFSVKPSLLLVVVVFCSVAFEPKWAFLLCLFCGIIRDSLAAASPIGINTLLFCLWFYCVIKASRLIPLDNNAIRIILVSLLVFFHSFSLRLASFVLGRPFVGSGTFFYVTLLEITYTALIVPLVFIVFKPTRCIEA